MTRRTKGEEEKTPVMTRRIKGEDVHDDEDNQKRKDA